MKANLNDTKLSTQAKSSNNTQDDLQIFNPELILNRSKQLRIPPEPQRTPLKSYISRKCSLINIYFTIDLINNLL